jgi:hypothetical protein
MNFYQITLPLICGILLTLSIYPFVKAALIFKMLDRYLYFSISTFGGWFSGKLLLRK